MEQLLDFGDSQVVLTKSSTSEQIKQYFLGILELSNSGEDFPIDLDEVWPLAYSTKGNALKALIGNFLQDVDYKVFIQNDKNPNGGRPTNIYKLSVSCLEYFVARKVREVFEVYRLVFHRAVKETQEELMARALSVANDVLAKREERIRQLVSENTEMKPKAAIYDKVIDRLTDGITTEVVAKEIGLTEVKLYKLLVANDIVFRTGNKGCMYCPKSPYESWGLHTYATHTYYDGDGNPHQNQTLKWTAKGRMYILALYENGWDKRKANAQLRNGENQLSLMNR